MLNNPLLSPQELRDKTNSNRNAIQEMLDKGKIFTPEDASVTAGLSMEDRFNVEKTIRNISLKEFLGRGQTLGDYLVAAKVHDTIVMGSRLGDRVPYISAYVANGWAGSDLQVEITGVGDTGWSFTPTNGSSGAIMATDTGNITRATCLPMFLGYNIRIANDLLDDAEANGDLIQRHVQWAGQEMGMQATRMAVVVLLANADGVGTAGAIAGDSGEVKFSASDGKDVWSAWSEVKQDGFHAQTIIPNYESAHHSILASGTGVTFAPAKEGFDYWLNGFDVYVHPYIADLTSTRYCAIVFDRNNALFTARKRWLQMENYSDPVKDLAGAVVTARQDSVTLFKDATCKITEAE